MKRILVLDDDEAILNVLQEALTSLNYQVKAIKEANKLSQVIVDFRPDVLLLDFMLSNANGGAICHQLKTQPEFSTLPVLIMSGYNDVEELSSKAGADGFIKKPFDLSELDKQLLHCLDTIQGKTNELA